MSGRHAMILPPGVFRTAFGYDTDPPFPPRFNIAPTQPIAIVRGDPEGRDGSVRRFQLVWWGFVPAFVKDFSQFKPVFNAWCERLTERASFRAAFRRRRCLVVADGFYAWQKRGATSHPFLLRRIDCMPFGMAGLTETWLGAEGSELDTACIITAPAEPELAFIHPRSPVIVAATDFAAWLDPDESRSSQVARLLLPASADTFEAVPIGPAINKVTNDDASVQIPIGPAIRFDKTRRGSGPQGELF